ncbi:MAG: P-loop NTPase, partial [Myxococcales bacterium]|nr:P-loop NTPase [Myxococcales bacterium]
MPGRGTQRSRVEGRVRGRSIAVSRRTDPPPPSAAAPPDEPDEAELDAALDALDALDASPPAPIDRTSIDSLIIEARDPDDSEGPVEPPPVLDPLPWLDAPVGPLRIAVAGGKGGVGRSLLTANLGLMMARLGRSVLLADLDPNGPALHTYLGL